MVLSRCDPLLGLTTTSLPTPVNNITYQHRQQTWFWTCRKRTLSNKNAWEQQWYHQVIGDTTIIYSYAFGTFELDYAVASPNWFLNFRYLLFALSHWSIRSKGIVMYSKRLSGSTCGHLSIANPGRTCLPLNQRFGIVCHMFFGTLHSDDVMMANGADRSSLRLSRGDG